MQKIFVMLAAALALCSCGGKAVSADRSDASPHPAEPVVVFPADSAYRYIETQVAFGSRVPNSEAHRRAADWLVAELRRHGADVSQQTATLKAFDGTVLSMRNIFGRFNPSADVRTLFVAHWDCRPWADEDPDPERAKLPVDGANDGASGVGVLLEMARAIGANPTSKGVDILFVDAEDWGTYSDEDSWALGANYFVSNRPNGYTPSEVIVLDMVGGTGAVFPREYFSQQSDPELLDRIYTAAAAAGYADRFPNQLGSAVTDDHIQFIKAGIPAVDIIDYRDGFHPSWHTGDDDMSIIDRSTLQAVGQTMLNLIYGSK